MGTAGLIIGIITLVLAVIVIILGVIGIGILSSMDLNTLNSL